jgi:hypothetical protein
MSAERGPSSAARKAQKRFRDSVAGIEPERDGKEMNSTRKHLSACLAVTAALLVGAPAAWAQTSAFAVLGFAAMSCTDGNIAGQVGTNQSITDVPPGAVSLVRCPTSGSHEGDQAAKAAYAAFLARYEAVKPKFGDVCTTLTGTLSNMTLSPGFYCFPAAAALTGVLTLDGPSNATWTFKIGSTLAAPGALPTGALTGTNFSVVMAGGGQACNVTWWTAEAATMTDSNLAGTILAGGAISETRGTQSGSAFAKAAATITGTAIVGCASEAGPGPGPGPGPGSCTDKVTGGGTIKVGLYGQASFGVAAGIRSGTPRGHLTYVDHATGMKVKSTGVTAYVALDARTRRIGGTAKVNGQSGFTFQVDVADNGEPGRNDSFVIRISDASGFVYTASENLTGGNIQLHKRECDRNGRDRGDDQDDRDDERDDR